MRSVELVRTLGLNDLRLVRRETMLVFLVGYPILWALVLRWGAPPLADWLRPSLAIEPYYPLIASLFLVLMPPLVFGFVIGFLLLDERDDRTLTALRVTPLPPVVYLAYRVLIPIALGVIMIRTILPVAELVEVSLVALTALALVAGIEGGITALFLASTAGNKVEGFALGKAMGVLPLGAVMAYFVESKWQYVFGLIPMYWPAKAFWVAVEGGEAFWLYWGVGLLYHLGLLWIFLRRFERLVLH